jgi:hypothetical protein
MSAEVMRCNRFAALAISDDSEPSEGSKCTLCTECMKLEQEYVEDDVPVEDRMECESCQMQSDLRGVRLASPVYDSGEQRRCAIRFYQGERRRVVCLVLRIIWLKNSATRWAGRIPLHSGRQICSYLFLSCAEPAIVSMLKWL